MLLHCYNLYPIKITETPIRRSVQSMLSVTGLDAKAEMMNTLSIVQSFDNETPSLNVVVASGSTAPSYYDVVDSRGISSPQITPSSSLRDSLTSKSLTEAESAPNISRTPAPRIEQSASIQYYVPQLSPYYYPPRPLTRMLHSRHIGLKFQ